MSFADYFCSLKEIYDVPDTSGLVDTYIDGVRFFWSTEHVPRAPLPHCKGIIVIGQGYKVGYLDNEVFRYDANNYLISSVPTSYECETFATPETPVLGILIDIDVTRLDSIIRKVDKHQFAQSSSNNDVFRGVEPVKMTLEMQVAMEKLLACLKSPMDCDVLGASLIDEVFYRAIIGNHGKALVSLTKVDSQYAKIAQSISFLHESYMDKILVDELAGQAHMSVSSYHRIFKRVTGDSPLQYLKKIRLNQARSLMMREGLTVNLVADKVGYDSVSQFSREFKRYFDISPSEASHASYSAMFSGTSR